MKTIFLTSGIWLALVGVVLADNLYVPGNVFKFTKEDITYPYVSGGDTNSWMMWRNLLQTQSQMSFVNETTMLALHTQEYAAFSKQLLRVHRTDDNWTSWVSDTLWGTDFTPVNNYTNGLLKYGDTTFVWKGMDQATPDQYKFQRYLAYSKDVRDTVQGGASWAGHGWSMPFVTQTNGDYWAAYEPHPTSHPDTSRWYHVFRNIEWGTDTWMPEDSTPLSAIDNYSPGTPNYWYTSKQIPLRWNGVFGMLLTGNGGNYVAWWDSLRGFTTLDSSSNHYGEQVVWIGDSTFLYVDDQNGQLGGNQRKRLVSTCVYLNNLLEPDSTVRLTTGASGQSQWYFYDVGQTQEFKLTKIDSVVYAFALMHIKDSLATFDLYGDAYIDSAAILYASTYPSTACECWSEWDTLWVSSYDIEKGNLNLPDSMIPFGTDSANVWVSLYKGDGDLSFDPGYWVTTDTVIYIVAQIAKHDLDTCPDYAIDSIGACCYEEGFCDDDINEAACDSTNGSWEGIGTTCEGVTCPPPITFDDYANALTCVPAVDTNWGWEATVWGPTEGMGDSLSWTQSEDFEPSNRNIVFGTDTAFFTYQRYIEKVGFDDSTAISVLSTADGGETWSASTFGYTDVEVEYNVWRFGDSAILVNGKGYNAGANTIRLIRKDGSSDTLTDTIFLPYGYGSPIAGVQPTGDSLMYWGTGNWYTDSILIAISSGGFGSSPTWRQQASSEQGPFDFLASSGYTVIPMTVSGQRGWLFTANGETAPAYWLDTLGGLDTLGNFPMRTNEILSHSTHRHWKDSTILSVYSPVLQAESSLVFRRERVATVGAGSGTLSVIDSTILEAAYYPLWVNPVMRRPGYPQVSVKGDTIMASYIWWPNMADSGARAIAAKFSFDGGTTWSDRYVFIDSGWQDQFKLVSAPRDLSVDGDTIVAWLSFTTDERDLQSPWNDGDNLPFYVAKFELWPCIGAAPQVPTKIKRYTSLAKRTKR